jgi:acyl-homoserine-lactone acylase
MKMFALALLLVSTSALGAPDDLARWQAQAKRVSIARDDYGIAHVKGKSDADAVFGMIYAQAEDDFNRVETNFINAQGRLAEAEGEAAIWRDLRMKLFITPDALKADYARSPAWLKALMVAWADGLNFYLATHPEVKPRVITLFEPWMALSFSEGSIGGDIEDVSLRELRAFYDSTAATAPKVATSIELVHAVRKAPRRATRNKESRQSSQPLVAVVVGSAVGGMPEGQTSLSPIGQDSDLFL